MANSKFNTSISINSNTRDKLIKFRDRNNLDSYDDAINELMSSKQGYVREFKIIPKPIVALTIESKALYESEIVEEPAYDHVEITYDDLKNSSVGKKYIAKKPDSEFYVQESAEIVYKTDSLILLELVETVFWNQLKKYSHLVGVELL